jgi:hypothetical protein
VGKPPDFELIAGLRARVLVSHAPPDAFSKTEGEDVVLEGEDARQGLPAEMRPRGKYRDVTVQKHVVARMAAPRPPAGRGYNFGR